MESNKSTNPDATNPILGSSGSTHTTIPEEPKRSAATFNRDKKPETAKEMWNKGAEVYDQTKQAVTQAYDKTAQVVSTTYDQAMTYGRENPGKLTLIAFGAGIGFGLLLTASTGTRHRTRRYAEPVVNALYDIALEFFRR